ncbi:MAG: hypothetical protein ACREXR_12750, partial [Gammaproteobacteria bacterium]
VQCSRIPPSSSDLAKSDLKYQVYIAPYLDKFEVPCATGTFRPVPITQGIGIGRKAEISFWLQKKCGTMPL